MGGGRAAHQGSPHSRISYGVSGSELPLSQDVHSTASRLSMSAGVKTPSLLDFVGRGAVWARQMGGRWGRESRSWFASFPRPFGGGLFSSDGERLRWSEARWCAPLALDIDGSG